MRRLSIVAAIVFAATIIHAQETPTYTENVSVGYVMIPFTVVGENGTPMTELKSKDIKLMIDGDAVTTDLFEKSQNAPVSFTILLDGSGSMGLAGKMDAARSAVGTLIANRRPGDDFALYVFDDKEAHEVVPFTEDGFAIFRALEKVKPFGKTAFFDALATMPERSRLGRNPTRAIILLSDGIDNNSHLTREGLARTLQGVAIPIYPLGLRERGEKNLPDEQASNEELSDLELLDEIANLTGGRMFLGVRPQQLSKSVAALDHLLRAQFLIGFSPTGKGTVKYRRISLRVAGHVKAVRVRAGYFGTEPPYVQAASREAQKRSEKKGT